MKKDTAYVLDIWYNSSSGVLKVCSMDSEYLTALELNG